MRFVLQEGNCLEINFMWLPTFIGQNFQVLRELETALNKEFRGKQISEGALDDIQSWIVQWLGKRFNLPGLDRYLAGIKYVRDDNAVDA